MKGKEKCKVLKQIRSDIAKANDIPLEIPECTHKGECKGTCPRCEAEVKYLERQLENRRKRGFKIVVAGISAGIVALNAASCDIIDEIASRVGVNDLQGDMIVEHSDGIMPPDTTENIKGEIEIEVLEGDIVAIPDEVLEEELIQGAMPVDTDIEDAE